MRYPLVVLLLGLFLLSCKDNSTNSGAYGNGEVYSYVYLLDSLNGQDITPRDFSSVRIWIDGGSQSTFSDSDGQFELQGVPVSSPFTLVFSKRGYADKRDIDHHFTPSNQGSLIETYNTVLLYQIRQLTPNLVLRPFLSKTGADTPYTQALFTSRIIDSLPQYTGYVKLYFGKSESISPQNPDSYLYTIPLNPLDAQSGIATMLIYRDSLLNNGFQAGNNVYCIAYYTGFYTKNEFYIDKATGKRIYTGLSPFTSGVKSFVLP